MAFVGRVGGSGGAENYLQNAWPSSELWVTLDAIAIVVELGSAGELG